MLIWEPRAAFSGRKPSQGTVAVLQVSMNETWNSGITGKSQRLGRRSEYLRASQLINYQIILDPRYFESQASDFPSHPSLGGGRVRLSELESWLSPLTSNVTMDTLFVSLDLFPHLGGTYFIKVIVGLVPGPMNSSVSVSSCQLYYYWCFSCLYLLKAPECEGSWVVC